jgi:hypothetical protein
MGLMLPMVGSVLATAVALAAVVAQPPRRLSDGSIPPAVPAPLHGLDGNVVTTRLWITSIGRLGRLARDCDPIDRLPADRPVIERVGVAGRGVTFVNAPGRIQGCDIAPGSSGTPFCGITGRSRDETREPGLTICQNRRGRPVAAFAWIDPVREATWLVVDQSGYREVYPVLGTLPVRVASVSVPLRGSVRFRTSQYNQYGRLLVKREVDAVVAG